MSRPKTHRRRGSGRSGGFTLVELLVTVTIITILATVVLAAIHLTRQSAREARTRSTIRKLDQIIMARWESYRTRRVPISTAGVHPNVALRNRLDALRDLMRMEMPERWSDVSGGPIVTGLDRPSLSAAYLAKCQAATPSDTYASAECLYMIVSAAGADARGQFHESEIDDVDGDGFREFIDGWGNPIQFFRWAPGFTESDIQARTFFLNPNPPPRYAPNQTEVQDAAENDHDPFDQRRLHARIYDTDGNYYGGYRLVPLIYSAGADGIYDLNRHDEYVFQGDPYSYMDSGGNREPNRSGSPIDQDNTSKTATGSANGSEDHFDNIHNHRIEAR